MEKLISHYISAVSGAFPEIATKEGINTKELEEEFSKPTYLTVPIAVINGVADDGFKYTREFVEHLQRKILSDTITGHMGHMSDKERETAFPVPVAMWVGAELVDDKLWAKAFITDEQVAQHIRQLKKVGGTIATSIYGPFDAIIRNGDGTYTTTPEHFHLEHIDLAPPQRAALDIPGRKMKVTAHMEGTKEKQKMDKKTFLAQMKVEEIPETLLKSIKEPQEEVISQLKNKLEEATGVLSQMKDTINTQAKLLFEYKVKELVGAALPLQDEGLADYVETKVLSHFTAEAKLEDIQAKVTEIVESPTFVNLSQSVVMAQMGGKVRTTVKGTENTKTSADLVEEDLDNILAEFGLKN